MLMKLTDDTKFGGTVNTGEDRNIFQEKLNDFTLFPNITGMEFNNKSCKVMYLGTTIFI